jgi:hypothetical protein
MNIGIRQVLGAAAVALVIVGTPDVAAAQPDGLLSGNSGPGTPTAATTFISAI